MAYRDYTKGGPPVKNNAEPEGFVVQIGGKPAGQVEKVVLSTYLSHWNWTRPDGTQQSFGRNQTMGKLRLKIANAMRKKPVDVVLTPIIKAAA